MIGFSLPSECHVRRMGQFIRRKGSELAFAVSQVSRRDLGHPGLRVVEKSCCGLFFGHFDEGAFRQFAVEEMDDAVFDVAFEDLRRWFWR
jgi:hypothetical protein